MTLSVRFHNVTLGSHNNMCLKKKNRCQGMSSYFLSYWRRKSLIDSYDGVVAVAIALLMLQANA